ncbi:MAG: MCE family protein, partial [Xanthomonadaceae bacterium]|nr:MCE family protein [Xanthomonadaceae bacterium]
MSYNKMKIAVGIFAILFIVIITAFLLFILNEKGLFEKKYPFAFYAGNASYFSLGTPIKYVGFEIGSIQKIELTYDGKVFAHFTVSKKYRQLVNKKSFLMLKKPLIGSPVIALVSEPNNTMLHPHAILQFTVQDDINDLVVKFEPIVKKLQTIITSIDIITTRMADPNGPFFQTLANIEKTSHTLAAHDSVINALTGDRESAKNVATAIKTLKQSMEEVEKITTDIEKMLGEANKNIIEPTKDIGRNINEIL